MAAASRQLPTGKRRNTKSAVSRTAPMVNNAAKACGTRQLCPNTRIHPAFQ